jgi:hypothetical protein
VIFCEKRNCFKRTLSGQGVFKKSPSIKQEYLIESYGGIFCEKRNYFKRALFSMFR